MSKKNFIGGGFPGIKENIDEKNIITKESTEKREFSVKKIISINNILKTKNKNQTKNSEFLNIKEAIQYDSVENLIHNPQIEESNIDINQINRPIRKKRKSKK